ncbi:MAG: amino acid ABC transporter substrate-binding protein [Thermodesulfobacteriota bacterium]
MKARLLFYGVCWFALLQIIVCGAMAASTAPESIPVGACISMSGPYSNLGGQAKAGYEIATEEINRSGGVFVKEYGRKIPLELIIQDTESVPMKAVSSMEWLHTSKKVVVYIGEGNMVNGQAVAERNKIPALAVASPHQAPHERGLKYWFAPFSKSPDTAKAICDVLDTIPADKRPKTVASFEEQSDWAIEQAEALKKEAVKRGYKVVVAQKYPRITKDFSPLIMAAKNAGAEAVFSSPVAPDGMTMMRQMKELDYSPNAVVVLRGAEDLSWGKALGPVGDYVIIGGTPWHHRINNPGADKLNAAFQSKLGRPADLLTGPAYASMQILAAAIEKAGTLDTTKIRDAISATDLVTVIGKTRFRPDGTLIDPCPAVIQWLGADRKLVWPKEFRETPFVYPIPPWKER